LITPDIRNIHAKFRQIMYYLPFFEKEVWHFSIKQVWYPGTESLGKQVLRF